MLKIYNTLSKQKEEFKPMIPGHINMYVCGVTVYDYCHIGHARTYLAFDVIIRYLRQRYTVNYVRNITDIDDKIIKRAQENNESIETLTKRYTDIMHSEFAKLGIELPNAEPTVTDSLQAIEKMINTLLEKEYAYIAVNGDIYYKLYKAIVGLDDGYKYGKLNGEKLVELFSKLNTEQTPVLVPPELIIKDDARDFALWKAARENEPNWSLRFKDPRDNSVKIIPGRPGWHIECSAMCKKILGDTFDIHGGGSDLMFPHHENEIAQSTAANGVMPAKYWLHSGMVKINAEKMSKSLGNFFIINDVLKQYPAEVVRYFLVSAHYRSEINYSDENLQLARAALTRFYTALRGLPEGDAPTISTFREQFNAAMDDDFNTPEAIAVLFELAREINRLRDSDLNQAANLGALLKQLAGVLGVLQQDPEQFLQGHAEDSAEIEALIAKRNAARQAKDWAAADNARKALTDKGIILEDTAQGTTWRRLV